MSAGRSPANATALAIEAANTWMAVRGRPQDTIRDPDALLAWLKQHLPRLAVPSTPAKHRDLDTFRRLRDAIRSLADDATAGRPHDLAAIETLNTVAASAPTWPQLSMHEGAFHLADRSTAPYVAAALATVAREAILLFGGADVTRVAACEAPGCVQFFMRDHARRKWCCSSCGNRARVARHYQRHHHV
jgi:predicted RNA-binding Zn ribbon-like protein